MSDDPFSDILRFAKAETLVTGGFTAAGDWALRFPVPEKIKFFAVVKGHCWVKIDGEGDAVRFDTGDVGLLTAPRSFVLASDPDLRPVDAMSLFSGAGRDQVAIGGGGEFAHIGGHVLLDPISGSLLADALPPWIHVGASSPQAATFRWLLDLLVEERSSPMPGSQLASAQLAQLLFIQILRAHLKTANLVAPGWLRALGDPRLAPALTLMHGEPTRSWHLEELAAACAMSRTTFALHFRKVTGVAPLTYLSGWRMRLAERALREEKRPVSAIADSLGYASEGAFSTAFKRATGQSPRDYRRSAHAALSEDDVDQPPPRGGSDTTVVRVHR